MIKNYIIVAFRHILKNKTHSAINIFGLAIAFVCSILLLLTAVFDFSFDNFHKDKDRIFKVYQRTEDAIGEQLSGSMPYPAAASFKNDVSDIERASRYVTTGGTVNYQGKELNLNVNLADNDLLSIFTFPVVKGMQQNALSELGNVVITETAAQRLFSNQDPIGKLIKVKISGEWKDLMVSAILQNIPRHSSLNFDVLARIDLRKDYAETKDKWNFSHHTVFVKLLPQSNPVSTAQKLSTIWNKNNALDSAYMKSRGYVPNKEGFYASLNLLPLSEFHFNPSVGLGNTTSPSYLYMMLLIGFFILAIACFNFINLNIAQAFTRMKEVGVRKCLGANQKQIFSQIWGESLLICSCALILGIIGAALFLPYYNALLNTRLSLDFLKSPLNLGCMVSGALLVSFLAGGYPAWFVSKFNTVSVLKGKISFKKSGVFRNSLIVLQFTIACLLMICTVIAYQQFQFMRTKPLGFSQESVISIPISNYENGRHIINQFRNRLRGQASVMSISGSDVNIGIGKDGDISKSSSGFDYNGNPIFTNTINVDYDFLKTMDIKLLGGRDFDPSIVSDTLNSVVVTEGLARQFKVKEPLGLAFYSDSSKPKNIIIGIVPDFHLYSLHEDLEPTMMFLSKKEHLSYALIKTMGQNSKNIMAMAENIYKELEPNKPFQGSFINENINRWYEKEKKISQLLGISASLAILLSCLGLFAIALLMIEQRVKEIGVRKVLGASVSSITGLLSKDFLILVVLAFFIASPLAWWAMNQWLQDFPYRIHISLGVFAFTGILAILIAFLTVSFQVVKAALANPVKSLRTE